MNQLFVRFLFIIVFQVLMPITAGAAEYQAGGVTFLIPDRWTEETPESRLRRFQFKIFGVQDSGDATLAIFHFGANEGGGVNDNIDRWISQFSRITSKMPLQRDVRAVGALTTTTIYLDGTFSGNMPGLPTASIPDYAVLATIVDGPEGFVFFKLMGPKETVKIAESDFRKMISALKT